MDKKFMVLMVIFFIAFGVFVTYFARDGLKIANFARASTETDPSPQTSLIFAWPQVPNPKIRTLVDVNIFIRNGNGVPLDQKPVRVVTDLGTINGAKEATVQTDKGGRVNLKLTSDMAGTAHITAFVTDSKNISHQLNQTVSVQFE